MGQHHAPCHDGGDLAVEVEALAQVEQGGQVGLAELPRALAAVEIAALDVAVAEGDVGRQLGEGLRRAAGHEGVAARLRAARLGAALQEPGEVVHAGFLETL